MLRCARFPGRSRPFGSLQQAGIKVALNTGFNRAITQTILDRLGWSASPLIDATSAVTRCRVVVPTPT